MKQNYYFCDPDKNINCLKTYCYKNGGECRATTNPDYAVDNYNGVIVAADPEQPKPGKAVCYMATKNFYNRLYPSINSLCLNTSIDTIYVLAEDDELPFDIPGLKVINVSEQYYFKKDGPNFKPSRFSWIVLMRAALHRIFPDLDRILSIDADTIILDSISDLWELDLNGYYVAGCMEPAKSAGGFCRQEDIYINMGVSMFNLDLLRSTGKGDEIIADLNKNYYDFREQDCINHLCQGGIKVIPPKYNATRFTFPVTDPEISVLHFAAYGGWYDLPIVEDYKC